MLPTCDSLLAATEEQFLDTKSCVNLSKGDVKMHSDGLFSIDGVCGMLKVKKYKCIDMVCSQMWNCGQCNKKS